MKQKRETNKHFRAKNKEFITACKEANIKPSVRQASKFRRQEGAAYKISKGFLVHIPPHAMIDK